MNLICKFCKIFFPPKVRNFFFPKVLFKLELTHGRSQTCMLLPIKRERERDIYIYIYIYNFQLTVFKLVVWQLGTTWDVVRTRFDP